MYNYRAECQSSDIKNTANYIFPTIDRLWLFPAIDRLRYSAYTHDKIERENHGDDNWQVVNITIQHAPSAMLPYSLLTLQ